MARFYPVLRSGAAAVSVLIVVALVSAARAGAQQSPAAVRERPALGSTITVAALGELPASENALSLLDGAQADLIGDRLHLGGVEAAAIGKHRELIAAEQVIGEDVEMEIAI